MNPLPGLHEALRLMALNDLDYAPGTIMKRIEQLEGELVKTVTHAGDCYWWSFGICDCGYLIREHSKSDPSDEVLNQWCTHAKNIEEHDHLKSTLAQRDEQLRVALVQLHASQERCRELEAERAVWIRTDIRAYKTVLKECVAAMQKVIDGDHVGVSSWNLMGQVIIKSQALLNEGSK
jgi:hypothetical protein